MRLQHSRYLRLFSALLPLAGLLSPLLQAEAFPGGFIEQPATASARPMLSKSTILDLLPQRGRFTFPAPYNTEAVRLTNADDCNSQNCVNYIGYSYWNNINNHVGQDSMLIFVGLDRSRGGVGPSLLQYNKLTDAVENLGPLFPSSSPYSWASGEGWYFSATMPTALYIPDQTRLQRYDVITETFTTVFDVTAILGSGYALWQTHSSADDRVHSATLKQQGSWATLGCVVYKEDTRQLLQFGSGGGFDECQVDKSGNWLLIKEDVDNADGEDNRIINLVTGQERILLDRAGAAGHSDMGHGYMIAADNWANAANTWKVWDFNAATLKGVVAYANANWNIAAPAHVSHSNAKAGSAAAQYACGSSANRSISAAANEIVCFGLAGTGDALIVAPVMTDLDASGDGDAYSSSPKGNLDVTGKYFIWSSNMGGNRQDIFLVKVPSHLLGLSGDSSTVVIPPPENPPPSDPLPSSPPPSSPSLEEPVISTGFASAPLVWEQVVNAVANGNTLTKNGGCNGCADAGGVSRQALQSGDGFLEFTVDGLQKQHYAGLSAEQAGTNATMIDFALSMQGAYAEVRENGVYRADTAIASGDVLRISVLNGKVSYARNGKVFYTSTVVPVYPLRAYSSLLEASSSISNAMAGAAAESGTETTPMPEPLPSPPPAEPQSPPPAEPMPSPPAEPVVNGPEFMNWVSLVKATAVDGTLAKVAGCDGCADAGAVSGQVIKSGAGYMEMTVSDVNKLVYTGLSVQKAGTVSAQIDYALSLQGRYAEVRENGKYRADVAIARGDILRIAVLNGKVSYSRNGKVFYTSQVAPIYPLRTYATLLSSGSSIGNAMIKLGL